MSKFHKCFGTCYSRPCLGPSPTTVQHVVQFRSCGLPADLLPLAVANELVCCRLCVGNMHCSSHPRRTSAFAAARGGKSTGRRKHPSLAVLFRDIMIVVSLVHAVAANCAPGRSMLSTIALFYACSLYHASAEQTVQIVLLT